MIIYNNLIRFLKIFKKDFEDYSEPPLDDLKSKFLTLFNIYDLNIFSKSIMMEESNISIKILFV